MLWTVEYSGGFASAIPVYGYAFVAARIVRAELGKRDFIGAL
jgi:hypothetical protein